MNPPHIAAAPEAQEADLRHNFRVNAIDAAFFGLALGLASFVTVVPLLISGFTDSRLLVGMIASVQPLGWHLPQVLMAQRVADRDRLLPTILRTTTIERLPFFLLAGLAWVSGSLSAGVMVLGVYCLVFWIGIGGGLTATPFQEMVGRIVPTHRWGLFYGIKTAAATATIAFGSVASGRLLERHPGPRSFALLFLSAGIATMVSFYFLSRTRERERVAEGKGEREPERERAASNLERGAEQRAGRPPVSTEFGATVSPILPAPVSLPENGDRHAPSIVDAAGTGPLWTAADAVPERLPRAMQVLREDGAFRWYLLARAVSQLAVMTAGYYTVLALRRFGAGAELIGWLAASLAISQALANPIMGWAGDRWGHRNVMAAGMLAGSLGAFLALSAPEVAWLFPAYVLTGIAMNAAFVIPLSLNLRFGNARNRPIYLGLSSTVTAPSIVLAPLLGGYVMERVSFEAGFGIAVLGGLLAAFIVRLKVYFPTARSSSREARSSPGSSSSP